MLSTVERVPALSREREKKKRSKIIEFITLDWIDSTTLIANHNNNLQEVYGGNVVVEV
jgi:hypothetical protein